MASRPTIFCVVGARPNFIKAWPLITYLKGMDKFNVKVVHSGQHYDAEMSSDILRQLNFPEIDIQLEISKSESSVRYSELISKFKSLFFNEHSDGVIVFGDVNTTVAAALGAVANDVPVHHVESGLRSFDVKMPEEVNRIIVDNISERLFTTEESANRNLISEGFSLDKICFSGNLMIETLLRKMDQIDDVRIPYENYYVATFHRAENISEKSKLTKIFGLLKKMCKFKTVVLPLHPATRNALRNHNISIDELDNLIIERPLSYFEFVKLMKSSEGVVTDSGGIQEEAVFLDTKIATLRTSTERPITTEKGCNKLFDVSLETAEEVLDHLQAPQRCKGSSYLNRWDWHTSARICADLSRYYNVE